MTEYSRMVKGFFTSTGNAKAINIPFVPDYVELQNKTVAAAGPAASVDFSAYWDSNMGSGVATMLAYNAGSVLIADFVASQGITPFQCGLSLQYGPQLAVASTTKATGTVTTAAPHGLATGDVVILEGAGGWPQILGVQFTVTVTSPTAFTINWNTNQANYADPGALFVRKVLCPYLYLPGQNVISALDLSGANVKVTTTTFHNYVLGQEIGFQIPAVWGSTQLNELPNNTTPGSPVYYYVSSIQSNTQFTCTALSAGVTALNTNQPAAPVAGQSFPQVVAVGDVNSGGFPYSGGALYPSPTFPTFSGGVPTINGPAIQGAFVNNTSQGFIIGAGAGTNSAAILVGSPGDVIFWRAFLHDGNF